MSVVYPYQQFNIKDISFGAPYSHRNGSKTVNIKYPHKEIRYLQSSKCKIPFDPYSNSFCVSLTEPFEKKLRELEAFVKKEAQDNSILWFGKELTSEELEQLYTPLFSESKTKGYPPFMRINITDDYNVSFYDTKTREPIDKTQLTKGCEVRLVLKFVKIYINKNKKFKITMEMIQTLLYNKPPEESAFPFLESDDDE